MVSFLILLSSFTIISIQYYDEKKILLEGIDTKLFNVAYLAKEMLPETYHDKIADKYSVSEKEYRSIVERYNELCVKLGLQYIWSVMLIDEKVVFTSGTSTSKDVNKGDHASFFEVHTTPESFAKAIDTMVPQYASFHNKWGDGRMVLLPTFDAHKRKVIFCASMSLDEVSAKLYKDIINSILVGLCSLLAGLFFSFIITYEIPSGDTDRVKIKETALTKWKYSIILTGFSMLFFMTLFETIKEFLIPNISSWGSHIITILFTSLFAIITSYFIFKNINKKNQELDQKIIERKLAEEKLIKYKELFSQINDLAYILDAQGNILYINEIIKDLAGHKAETLLGNSFAPLFDEKNLEITMESYSRSLAGEQINTDIRFKETDILCEFKGMPLRDDNENIIGVMGIARDITERKKIETELYQHRNQLEELIGERTVELQQEIINRKQAEKQQEILLNDLVHANSELKDFSYTVSHDLKAPLRGISSIAQWLSEDYSESLDKKGQEYLDKLLLRTKRMHELIQGILQYSRVGRTKSEPQQLDSKKMIQEIADSIALPENITITIEELPIIKYDKTLFIQVFQNLIENAVQHLDKPSGEIVVSCIGQGGSWEFCVKDNGVGIEEKHHDRIFKIFQSLKPHSVVGSTGIGLTLVKKIIEGNGGKVWLESLVDKSSSFFITIPR